MPPRPHKITEQLTVSLDVDPIEGDKIVFLVTPDPRNTADHYHIEVEPVDAASLQTWLQLYIPRGEEK